ncbi:CRISPR-associated Cse1 family protein [Alcanivorax sp. S71-1-4]|uniref:type I-E CRISPR-associated protein Cse1/CasA n=1 Tax=Alcanivorax sp. S71-1-4 TaxID=1177159 RepID=UPI001358301C|nr:type I-E CRISPR-associated protein Cse1/CasA [Alcanivorax sp. S71-1-4]KAF0805180.1 CRISPR-associated Cse1 family protein [Alcanivorax sp. S71-1-4]
MGSSYNLLDEPWLPVRLADGHIVELGLLETFARSADIVALAETAPPSLVAQYRLLLAITHRALTRTLGGWREKDRARWYREGLPLVDIRDYLECWRDHFWLFHPDHPFMQVAALANAEETCDKRKPWTQIALASANGNTPVVFDHAHDGAPIAIRPADAIRMLLGFLQFTPGGLVKTLRDADKAGALVNTAAIVPLGATLAQTLCLCLHPAPRQRGEDDLPAWERPPLSIAELRGDPLLATGPNDRYTRQSRAVQLLHEDDGTVCWLRFAAGLALGEDPNAPDPMASFRAGSMGLVRLTFSEGRALWRDLPALVPNASGESQPAAVLNNAIALHRELDPSEVVYQPFLVAGLASDQAKLLRWRVEQIVLPATLLDDAEKALYLRELVGQADALFKDLNTLVSRMLSETLPDSTSKDTRNRARTLLDAGPFASSYFAAAEQTLPEVLRLLGQNQPEQATARWHTTLKKSACVAREQVLISMGGSARALRADALYLGRFHYLLNKHLPMNDTPSTAKEALT